MSDDGVEGKKFYSGTVTNVEKNYGFILLEGDDPVPSVFFDWTSVGGAVDDLTKRFNKGCRIRARIELNTNRVHKVKYKASALMDEQSDSSIRGGDQYLKNYLETRGPRRLCDLMTELASVQGNCPKFLRNGNKDVVTKVVACRPDWFLMNNGFLCLCEKEIKVKDLFLSQMSTNKIKLTIEELEKAFSNKTKLEKYLQGDKTLIDGVKDFVSRHPNNFIFWDDCVWKKQNLLSDPERKKTFQKEMEATKYYLQFVRKSDFPLSTNSLSGHWGQANEDVKEVARPRPSEFNAFLKRNSFFFELNQNCDIGGCLQHRLEVIDQFWSEDSVSAENSQLETIVNHRQSEYVTQPSINFSPDSDSEKESKEYLQRYILKNGAKRCPELLSDLSRTACPDCPLSLKQSSFRMLSDLCQQYPEIFSIRNNFFCLTRLENCLISKIRKNLKGGKLSANEIQSVLSEGDDEGKYHLASGVCAQDCANFLERNAEQFLVWQNCVCDYDHIFGKHEAALERETPFECEMNAVRYYSGFVKEEGTEIVSLRGHFAQAPPEVRAVANAKEEDFTAFLKRNNLFFKLQGDKVEIWHKDRLKIIDKFWLSKEARASALHYAVPRFMQPQAPSPTRASVPNQETSAAAAPILPFVATPAPQNQALKLVKTSVQDSKAFSDSDITVEIGPEKNSYPNQDASSFSAQPMAFEPQLIKSDASAHTDGIYSSLDAKIFENLVGESISRLIKDEIHPPNTLNSLFLLRLNIGSSPKAQFRMPGDGNERTLTLKMNPIRIEDIQRIVRHEKVVRMKSPSYFGVKGTLHYIRSREQDGKLTGLTLFCQLHEADNGLKLDIWKGEKLTAVFCTDAFVRKQAYNYIRSECANFSTGDVLVIDVDGKLSGCGEEPHRSLGGVERNLCSELELPQAITESIQHVHRYVVINEVESTEQLALIQKLCGRGTQVIAGVLSGLKAEVKSMFS